MVWRSASRLDASRRVLRVVKNIKHANADSISRDHMVKAFTPAFGNIRGDSFLRCADFRESASLLKCLEHTFEIVTFGRYVRRTELVLN